MLNLNGKINTIKLIIHCGLDYFKNLFQSNGVIIQGSYETGNVGDLAIGKAIKSFLYKNFNISSNLTGYYYPLQNFKKYYLHIIGGGGIIHDYYEGNIRKRVLPFGTAKKNVVLGVGVKGFNTKYGKKLVSKLNVADLITVRDKLSKEKLSAYIDNKKIYVTACPAFLLEANKTKNDLTEENYNKLKCGISLRDWFFNKKYVKNYVDLNKQKNRYLQFVYKNLNSLQKKYDLFFIPFTPNDYHFALKHLKGKFDINIKALQSPQMTLNTINLVDKMICMRYHSLVFSLITKKPMFVISYADKTYSIAKEFNIPYIDIEKIKGYEKIEFYNNNNRIREINKIMKKRANKNFYLLKKIL